MEEKKVITTQTVASTAVPVETKKVAKYSAMDQFVYLIFGILDALLALRFIFKLTGANARSGITSLIYSVTNIFMAPFNYVFPTNRVEGAIFEWSVIVAIIMYALLAWVIMKLIRIFYTVDA